MPRTLALDVGTRRIGVAVSDPGGVVAQPLAVIEREGWETDRKRIATIVRDQDVDLIVVGYPLTLSMERGRQAELVDRFVARLRTAIPVTVVTWDERLTTAAAERVLLAADLRRAHRRRVRDAVAAAVLLQGYLDRRRASL